MNNITQTERAPQQCFEYIHHIQSADDMKLSQQITNAMKEEQLTNVINSQTITVDVADDLSAQGSSSPDIRNIGSDDDDSDL